MAKAQINYKEEAKVVIQQVPDTVTIELTMYEARVLRSIVAMHVIGNAPSRNFGTSEIYQALDDAGIKSESEIFFKGNLTAI